MKQKFVPMYFAGLLLLLASLACQAASGGKPASATSEAGSTDVPAASESAATPAPEQPLLPDALSSTGAGKACFGLQAGGLTCLDESGWQTYTSKNSKLSTDYLQAGATCPDGRIALASYNGISLFDGKNWEEIAQPKNYTSADGIACGKDGSIWVAHFKGISHYKDGNWKTYPSAELATGESANELVYGIVSGVDGKIWAVTSRSVVRFNDDKWDVFQKGQGFDGDLFFNALTIDSKGRPWAGYSKGVAVYENDSWTLIEKPDYTSPKAITFDARGQLWLTTLTQGATMYNGKTWTVYTKASEELPSDNTYAIAGDTLGRVWLGTSYGLTVFDGKTWQTYRMENSDIADNHVKFIVIMKDGPSLPAPVEKKTAILTGTLHDANKKPMAGKRVEICVETLGSSFKGETPCSGQPFVLSTKTDEKGVFTFENVPAGYYVMVAETGTSWAQLTDQFGITSERTLLEAGETHDIGTLTLEKDK